ncbi:ribonuclease P protein component [Francisella frigiditurris]|uniref:Ribonuclease P protein component n=1 Tax=Francisella frigiditurris TaxID=1542390 RepID=A0A1J0KV76_9GAMM|nr:ribonuclease P protein component [Francisella frigiditurris]
MQHNFCLQKNNILGSDEVKKAFADVQNKISTEHFTFLIALRQKETAGVCVIIAKKNVKKAFKRNLCRRLIKESFRLNKGSFSQKSLLVIAKRSAANATKESLWASIEKFYQILEKPN